MFLGGDTANKYLEKHNTRLPLTLLYRTDGQMAQQPRHATHDYALFASLGTMMEISYVVWATYTNLLSVSKRLELLSGEAYGG